MLLDDHSLPTRLEFTVVQIRHCLRSDSIPVWWADPQYWFLFTNGVFKGVVLPKIQRDLLREVITDPCVALMLHDGREPDDSVNVS